MSAAADEEAAGQVFLTVSEGAQYREPPLLR